MFFILSLSKDRPSMIAYTNRNNWADVSATLNMGKAVTVRFPSRVYRGIGRVQKCSCIKIIGDMFQLCSTWEKELKNVFPSRARPRDRPSPYFYLLELVWQMFLPITIGIAQHGKGGSRRLFCYYLQIEESSLPNSNLHSILSLGFGILFLAFYYKSVLTFVINPNLGLSNT